MPLSPTYLDEMISHMSTAAAFLIEQRIREAMRAAGLSGNPFIDGDGWVAERIMENHAACSGTGVRLTRNANHRRVYVELCPCFEVRIIRTMPPRGILHDHHDATGNP